MRVAFEIVGSNKVIAVNCSEVLKFSKRIKMGFMRTTITFVFLKPCKRNRIGFINTRIVRAV